MSDAQHSTDDTTSAADAPSVSASLSSSKLALESRRPPHFLTMHRLRSPWNAQFLAGQILSSQRGRASSAPSMDSNLMLSVHAASSEDSCSELDMAEHEPIARPFLRFYELRRLTQQCAAQGEPVCMHVAGGLIAVGFANGATAVYDMSQRERYKTPPQSTRVTALAISHNATFLSVGHASGDIYLYDLFQTAEPARHVAPIDPKAVAAGKGEGHYADVAITHVSFVGARKTAIISADAHGLCFYHSLGKILGMESNDTLCVYGQHGRVHQPIFEAAPLPLGTAKHASDENQFVALLLPQKLLLIGLKPSARTWYRAVAPHASDSAALAWFPATGTDTQSQHPVLAYSFGVELRALHLRTVRVRPRTPDERTTTGLRLVEENLATAPHLITQLQWIHRQLLLVSTTHTWHLFDFRNRKFTEWQPHDPLVTPMDAAKPSLHIWRSKAFVRVQTAMYIGDFVAWDARLTQLERDQEYVDALALALDLYNGTALGSGIGLPAAKEEQHQIIFARIEALEREGAAHLRTLNAKRFAQLCARAGVESQQFHVLFNEVYDAYESLGLESVFVHELEQPITQGRIRAPPPMVMQKLLAYCDKVHDEARMKQLILHVDPLALNLDQTVTLCEKHSLWDALTYVYGEALHDYVTPIAQMLRDIAQHVKAPSPDVSDDSVVDTTHTSLYTVFPVLSARLCGQRFPSFEEMERDEAVQAAQAVQSFLFSQDVFTAPDHKVIPIVDASSYPYVQLLLSYDAEAFLDVLDLVCESGIMDDACLISRQGFIDIVLRVCRDNLSETARVFAAIFVARNAAKYPQFVSLSLHQVEWLFDMLTSEAADGCDCEFALECLLSAHPIALQTEHIARLERAGFWRLYESALRKKRAHELLFRFFLLDRDGQHHAPGQLYDSVAELFTMPGRRKSAQQHELLPTLLACVNEVPNTTLGDVARLVSRNFAASQESVYDALDPDVPERQYLYLKPIFAHVTEHPPHLREEWVTLVARLCPSKLVPQLDTYGAAYFDTENVYRTAKAEHVYDAVLWVLDKRGETPKAMDELDMLTSNVVNHVHDALAHGMDERTDSEAQCACEALREKLRYVHAALGMAVRICTEHSTGPEATLDDAREQWFRVLLALMQMEHALTAAASRHAPLPSPLLSMALTQSRQFTQETLAALVTSVPSDTVSFAHLFRRLIDNVSHTQKQMYAEVRVVVDAMLSAYRLRCDVLHLAARLNETDTRRLFAQLAQERGMGWLVPAVRPYCEFCRAAMSTPHSDKAKTTRACITHAGLTFHRTCQHTNASFPHVV